MTRGLTLNNPMDLMHNENFTWNGEIWPTADPEGRLCQFDTLVNGIRAGTKDILAYFNRDGCKTIDNVVDSSGKILHQGIIPRYAPPPALAPGDDNDTESYVSFMCSWCSVKPNDVLDMANAAFVQKFMGGIIHFEQGGDVCNSATIAQAVQEAMAA